MIMDALLKRFDSTQDDDLQLIEHHGIAYARDMTRRVQYDQTYWQKVHGYRNTQIARDVNQGRIELLSCVVQEGDEVLDYGCGDGAFLDAATDAGFNMRGYEVLPQTRAMLMERKIFRDNIGKFKTVCMWDVLEHLPDPYKQLRTIDKDARLLMSIPIFESLSKIRQSRHYRPGEHFYYFTHDGLIRYMRMWGFRLLAVSRHEINAGREDIGAYAFAKDLPGPDEYIMDYHEMHLRSYYGTSAVELHFDLAWEWVRRTGAKALLDFGCGRSDLVSFFWNDGARTLRRYDPAIREHRKFPRERFNLTFCFDVLEHVPLRGIDRVLHLIASHSDTALFTISTRPARAELPTLGNAHCTLLRNKEWLRWIKGYFRHVAELPSQWEHELIVAAGHKVLT